jgi:hypothetical protein
MEKSTKRHPYYTQSENQAEEQNLQYNEKSSRKHKNSAIHILSSFVSGLHILADDEIRR